MGWAEVVARGRGAFQMALLVEACPKFFVSGDHNWATVGSDLGPAFPTQLNWTLEPDDVGWVYAADARNGDPKMGSVTFKLRDLRGNGLAHVLTNLMFGRMRSTDCKLAATATAIQNTITVDSTAGFPAPGVDPEFAWMDQECFSYTGFAAGPPRFTGCTRGVYYSRAVAHEYVARDGGNVVDFGITPTIRSVFPHWQGRRVRLLVAEVMPNGSLSSTIWTVWRGRIKASPKLDPSSSSMWSLECENVWDAQDLNVMSSMGTGLTVLTGFRVDNTTIYWRHVTNAGIWAVPSNGSFTLSAATFRDMDALLSQITVDLNADLDANGVTDDYQLQVEDDHITYFQSQPAAAGSGRLWMWWGDRLLTELFGQKDLFFADNGAAPHPIGAEVGISAAMMIHDVEPSTLDVESTAALPTPFDVEGDGYYLVSIVQIGECVYKLRSLTASTITIEPWTGPVGVGRQEILIREGESMRVTPGVALVGRFSAVWRQFMSNSNIPESWRQGLSEDDWDWDEIELNDPGGDTKVRYFLTKPTAFREMFLEDIRYANLLPSIGTDGKASVRPFVAPVATFATATLGTTVNDRDRMPTVSESDQRICSYVQVKAEPRFLYPQVAEIPNHTIAQEFQRQAKVTIISHGVWPKNFASHSVILASGYFEVFGGAAMVGVLPCDLKAAMLLPGDVVYVTHPLIPDGLTGKRGITNYKALVTKVDVRPSLARVDVSFYMLLDQARRGCWAPCARTVTLLAGGPPHGFTVSAGVYADGVTIGSLPCTHSPALLREGHYFNVGMKIIHEQFDDETPLSEQLTIAGLVGHSADGLTVYTTTPPVNDPAGAGSWWIRLDDYTTVGQTAEAQGYVHVCDEATGLIGGGDEGFKPA